MAKFCMECGPTAPLAPDQDVLRCQRCGGEERLPGYPLLVVTGASGSGKSAIVEPLRRWLPSCEVFETDLILDVAAVGWEAWRNAWLLLAYGIALNGRTTVLCGSFIPDHLERLPARSLVGPIRFCNLDCPDETLAARLRARPAWRGWTEEKVVEHQRFAGWLRERIRPSFDTSELSPEEVAVRVAAWVQEVRWQA